MSVETHRFSVASKGDTQVLDLTDQVEGCLSKGQIRNGAATVHVVGSTASITTTEYEPGLARTDLRVAYELFAPVDGEYEHEKTWNDDNGHSHVRASITGPSITVPLIDGELALGTWQQVVLIDFDTRRRDRQVIVQVIGDR